MKKGLIGYRRWGGNWDGGQSFCLKTTILMNMNFTPYFCLLYTSDAADE